MYSYYSCVVCRQHMLMMHSFLSFSSWDFRMSFFPTAEHNLFPVPCVRLLTCSQSLRRLVLSTTHSQIRWENFHSSLKQMLLKLTADSLKTGQVSSCYLVRLQGGSLEEYRDSSNKLAFGSSIRVSLSFLNLNCGLAFGFFIWLIGLLVGESSGFLGCNS